MFEIDTTRCRIRAWNNTAEERDMLRRWTTDLEMMRFITGNAWADADRDRFFERQRASLEKVGVCFGAVRLKATDEIVGIAGAQPLELVDDWHHGWWVDPIWQGKGLGSELAKAALNYTLNVAKRPRALAVIAPGNIASRRVAENAGMQYLATVRANTLEKRWKDEDVVLYESVAVPATASVDASVDLAECQNRR